MNAHTVMEEWEASPFDGGYDGLRDLQARRFSGAVEAGTAWLFVRDGDPLSVVRDLEVDPRPGDVEAFEDATGQVHEAPHPAAASLAAMLALDGDVRGQYYTEDTPLSTVHETLSGGGFTGYVELSENVLSGDYYVVYEDGAEDYLGVLGSSNRLITDDEAQSKAEGEVGIYSVVAVRFPDVEIPESESTATDAAGGAATGAGVGAGAGAAAGTGAAAGAGDSAERDDDASEDSSPAGGAGSDESPGASATETSAPGSVADPDPESGPVAGTDAGAVDADAADAGGVDTDRDDVDEVDTARDGTERDDSERDDSDRNGDEPVADATGDVEPPAETEATSGREETQGEASGVDAEPERTPSDDEGGMVTDPRSRPESENESDAGPANAAEPTRDEAPGAVGNAGDEPADDPGSVSAGGDDADTPDGAGTSRSDLGDAHTEGEATSNDPVMDGVTSHSVPSLDPERTGRGTADGSDADDAPGSAAATGAAAGAAAADAGDAESDAGAPEGPERGAESGSSPEARTTDDEPTDEPGDTTAAGGSTAGDSTADETSDERVEAVREEYESRLDELRAELQSLREERDRLQRRVSELESSGASGAGAGSSASGGTATGGTLSPAEALAGTSLFVREGTRGDATLDDAHAGRADQETLAANLRIEYHTQFDESDVTVDGEPFESWLRSSARYEFVEWLVTELLFEIRSTGTTSALRHLYDAIPDVDRVGFDDVVTIGDGQEGREVAFDVVVRNRMGEPLVVADIDEGREPTRAESLQPLIGDAEDVASEAESLVAAFSVTSSFFEPDALDVAREATSGSLLSREKYRSYVKLSRKNGFHLCLVESREESFHLAVPEL